MRHLLPALLAVPLVLSAQQPAEWPAATAAMDTYVASDQIVGSALVLIEDGKIVREHYTGFQNRGDKVAADRNTIWHWGSITKTLTAVAVMQVNRGYLFGAFEGPPYAPPSTQPRAFLDQAITSLVPETRRIHSDFGSMDRVTLRMLMSHSSGLQNGTWPWTKGQSWEPFEPTEWDQLVAMMPYMKLAFEPGSRYSYSNPGFVYLAHAIEQITGDPWEGRIYKSLFMPLGMQASYFGGTPQYLRPHRSHNYAVTDPGVKDRGADFDPGITIPNGGWNAPVTDLARWIGFLGGSADSATQAHYDALLPRTTLEEMWQPVVRVDADEEMGLSFFIRHEGGRKLVGHTGTQANFRSFFWLDPATRRAVLGVVNTSSDIDGNASDARYRVVMAAARKALSP